MKTKRLTCQQMEKINKLPPVRKCICIFAINQFKLRLYSSGTSPYLGVLYYQGQPREGLHGKHPRISGQTMLTGVAMNWFERTHKTEFGYTFEITKEGKRKAMEFLEGIVAV